MSRSRNGAAVNFYCYLVLVLVTGTRCDYRTLCGNRSLFQEPKGVIETGQEIKLELSWNCNWSIVTPSRSVIFMKFEYLHLGSIDDKHNETCLYVTSLDHAIHYANICSESFYDTLTVPANAISLSLIVNSETYLGLLFTSYIVNCNYEDLKCYNPMFYPGNFDKACTDGILSCDAVCSYDSVSCGDSCYDLYQQRCDGILDCVKGEDEIGCHPSECPEGIFCSTKCITPEQICDRKVDCDDEIDERNCPNFNCKLGNCSIERSGEAERSETSYIIIITLGVIILLFVYLICRCLARRDDVRGMLDHPLDVPLPPFRGPGDGTNTADEPVFHDEDFRPGGDIFESLTANMERIKHKRKSHLEEEDKENITFVKPADGQDVLHKYFNGVRPVLSEEMAALATIKISREMCYGLRKARSEEKPMTRLLFVDNKDDEPSDSGGSEDEDVSGMSGGERFKMKQSKSDTEYVRRKAAGGIKLNV